MHLKSCQFLVKKPSVIHPQLFQHYKALKSLHATSPSPSLTQRSLLYTYSAFNLCTGGILSVQYLAQRHNDEPPSCRAKTVPKRQANVKTLKAELLSCTQVKIPDVMFALQDLLSDQLGSLDTPCRFTDTCLPSLYLQHLLILLMFRWLWAYLQLSSDKTLSF